MKTTSKKIELIAKNVILEKIYSRQMAKNWNEKTNELWEKSSNTIQSFFEGYTSKDRQEFLNQLFNLGKEIYPVLFRKLEKLG